MIQDIVLIANSLFSLVALILTFIGPLRVKRIEASLRKNKDIFDKKISTYERLTQNLQISFNDFPSENNEKLYHALIDDLSTTLLICSPSARDHVEFILTELQKYKSYGFAVKPNEITDAPEMRRRAKELAIIMSDEIAEAQKITK